MKSPQNPCHGVGETSYAECVLGDMAPMLLDRTVAAPFCAATPKHHRARRWILSAVVAVVCLPALRLPAQTANAYERAQQLRAQLEAKPAPRRTRGDYNLVLDAYKVIYHGMPASPHAVDSIFATADVLEDEGRVFRDARLFEATVNEYEYLRQHYPSNPRRSAALLAEGRVEEHELRNPKAAEEKYRELIQRYPNTAEAADAHKALAALVPKSQEENSAPAVASQPAEDTHGKPSAAEPIATRTASRYGSAHVAASPTRATEKSASADPLGNANTFTHHGGPPAKLSSIRQLVTDTGVQLVFDLSSPAGFRTGRATNPTRLYFDLDNTHVDRSLTLHPMVVSADPAQTWLVKRIRAAQFTPTMTRVVLEVDDSADAYAQLMSDPWRLMIDIHSVSPPAGTTPQEQVAQTPPQTAPQTTDQTFTQAPPPQYVASGQAPELPLDLPVTNGSGSAGISNPPPVVQQQTASPSVNNANLTTHSPVSNGIAPNNGVGNNSASNNLAQSSAASPTSNGDPTLVRALGLKIGRVVIDAGHGGHDTGTIGPGGLAEKDVVLDIALRLGNELQQRLGVQVIYTRTGDVFIPLEQRTAIANNAQADLFISIHGNSSPESNVRGVETYYLSLTNQKDALEVATRENATSAENIHDLSDIVKRITMDDKIEESRELAIDVQQQLYTGLVSGNSGLKDRGIKKAPFVVLIGANMPSILTEISFVTNSKDAKELRDAKYRQRVADSLFHGISEYMASLSGVHTSTPSQSRKKK